MNWRHCDWPAHASCQFSGQVVCREHAEALPHIEGMFHADELKYKALVVPEAVHCGICRGREDPVCLPDLTRVTLCLTGAGDP